MEGVTEALEKMKKKENLVGWKRTCSCGKEFEINPSSGPFSFRRVLCDECIEKKKAEERRRMMLFIVPPKFRDILTDKKELLKNCINKSIFCYGNSGTGKTVFATSLAISYIKADKKVKYCSYPAFIMELRNAYRKDNPDIKTPWDIAEDVAKFNGVLILDDLGAEKTTDFVREITYFILNEREINLLTTIITSNFSLDELNNMIDSRVSSRIAGMCEVLHFTGEDRRIKKRK